MSPYIKPEQRLIAATQPRDVGELTFAMTRLALQYLDRAPESFALHAEILAALEATKLEFYRRRTAPYEEQKREENGDIAA